MFFQRLAWTCEETCQSVWPPIVILHPSSTCVHLRLLASPFDQGFMFVSNFVFTGVIPITCVYACASACASSRTTPSEKSIFYNELCNCLDLFSTPMALQTRSSKGEIFNDSVQFQTEKRNISRRRSRTSDYADIANVTFLICRGKQRNVQRFLSHVYSYCFSVTLSLPSSSWFA